MRMRLVLLVIGLLMAGVLLSACGDDDDEGGGGGGDTTAQTDTGGEGGGDQTATEEGDPGADPSGPQVEQAVEACRQQIESQPGISEDVRSDLLEICEKAASGDEQEVREATKEVCVKLIEENVPEGPAREQALASCEQATTTP